MKHFDPDNFRNEFAQRADKKLQEFYRAEKRHQKTELVKQETSADDDLMSVAQSSAQAAIEKIDILGERITQFKQLTIEEIMFLQGKLDSLLVQREAMLDKAFVLEDGTRVFKTLDGTAVFDEFGNSVGNEFVDPNLIGNDLPNWEAFSQNTRDINSAKAGLTEKIEFLGELDELEDALGQDDLTEDQLNDLEERLEAAIPESTRIRETALDVSDDIAKPATDFAIATTGQINLDALKISVPGLTN